MFAGLTLMGFHVAWACGWFHPLGLGAGFAMAEDVKGVNDQVREIKLSLLEQRIFDTRLRHCTASTPEARQFWRQTLTSLMSEYRVLAGAEYRLPTCEELQ